MEPESLYDDLITRYLVKEATPEEEKLVLKWMASEEKNRLYVEALQNALNLVSLSQEAATIDVDKEWEQVQQVVFQKSGKVLHINHDENPDWENSEEETQDRRAGIYKILIGAAIAASVVLVIGLSAGWFSENIKPESRIAQQKKPAREEAKIDPLMAVVQHEVNTSGKTKQLILPDGSKITLFDSSELTYKEPVEGNRRDVYLTGKADFRVAKNKAKPFIVSSEDISTTAIGTLFTVEAKKAGKTIQVKLLEGKVVVRPLKGYSQQWAKDIYLMPGQEVIYDKSRKTVTVLSFGKPKATLSKAEKQPKENPSIPKYDKRSWFMFNNQALSEIFDALGEMYDVKIVYSKKDVRDKYFIGTYDKTDSLEKILKQIALLNNLKVTKLNDTFRVEKPKLKK